MSIVVRRDGDRDLQFEGVKIGDGLWSGESQNRIQVQIFRLEKMDVLSGLARYVLAVHTCRRDEAERFHADLCIGGKALLQNLLNEGSGRLGSASKQAWTQACLADLELGDERYERL